MDMTTVTYVVGGAIWLVGAIVYGLHIRKTKGPEGAIAEALIWPISIVVRKGTDN